MPVDMENIITWRRVRSGMLGRMPCVWHSILAKQQEPPMRQSEHASIERRWRTAGVSVYAFGIRTREKCA